MTEFRDWSVTASANTGASINGFFMENMQYSEVNDAAREFQAILARDRKDKNGTLVAGGSTSSYVLSLSSTITSYRDGDYYRFRAPVKNAGATTLQVRSLSARPVVKTDLTALSGGEILAGGIYEAFYNSASANFQLLNPVRDYGLPYYYITDGEVAESIVPVRYQYPPGNLKRYTSNDGDGTTDVSAAWGYMLACGEKRCVVPTPETAWRINSTVTWVDGVSVECENAEIYSYVSSGQWTFLFDGITYANGGSEFLGFRLRLKTSGANGIRLWESRLVTLDYGFVDGEDYTGIGVELNGGDDASPTYGTAFCNIGDSFMTYSCATGVRMYTDNTTTPSDNTAFCNRNYIGHAHLNGGGVGNGGVGLWADRANTNTIRACPQGVEEGFNFGAYFKNNLVESFLEQSITRKIVLDADGDENIFGGSIQYTDFVDSGGTQIDPHPTCTIISSQYFRLPNSVRPPAGSLELDNDEDAGPMRIRPASGTAQTLILSQRNTSEDNVDLIRLVRAASPYAELANSAQLRMGTSSRLYWPTSEIQTTVGSAGAASALPATPTGYIKISVNGTDVVVPYYAAS